MMCGGTSSVKEATEEIQTICDEIREELESKVGHKFNTYEAKKYKSQVVAGTNFFVKINIDDGAEHIHARIFRPLPGQGSPKLHSFQDKKTLEDEIEYF